VVTQPFHRGGGGEEYLMVCVLWNVQFRAFPTEKSPTKRNLDAKLDHSQSDNCLWLFSLLSG